MSGNYVRLVCRCGKPLDRMKWGRQSPQTATKNLLRTSRGTAPATSSADLRADGAHSRFRFTCSRCRSTHVYRLEPLQAAAGAAWDDGGRDVWLGVDV